MNKIVLALILSLPLFAGDIMVERMQSVVDEVSELRKRYEDSVYKNEQCLSQLQEQDELLSQKGLNPSDANKEIQALKLENERLKQAHEAVKQESIKQKELKSELKRLNKENARLNTSAQILISKNQSLLEQVNKLKRSKEEPTASFKQVKEKEKLEQDLLLSQKTVKNLEKRNTDLEAKIKSSKHASSTKDLSPVLALQEKNKKLEEALKKCKNTTKVYTKTVKISKNVCIDDNPFPKLLKKEKKYEKKKTTKKVNKPKTKTSGVYRIKGESAVYDKPKGKVIEIWEDTRSFTSNVSKDKWVRITGYFVDRKWRKAKSALWVKKENTQRR